MILALRDEHIFANIGQTFDSQLLWNSYFSHISVNKKICFREIFSTKYEKEQMRDSSSGSMHVITSLWLRYQETCPDYPLSFPWLSYTLLNKFSQTEVLMKYCTVYTVIKASMVSVLYLEVPQGRRCIPRRFPRFICLAITRIILKLIFNRCFGIYFSHTAGFEPGIFGVGGLHSINWAS